MAQRYPSDVDALTSADSPLSLFCILIRLAQITLQFVRFLAINPNITGRERWLLVPPVSDMRDPDHVRIAKFYLV